VEYFYFSIIVLAASFLQGLTGFGFAILAAPLCLLFFEQQEVVIVLSAVSLLLNLYLVLKIKASPDFQILRQLLLAGIMGLPVGVAVLLMFNPEFLKISTSLLVLTFALLSLFPKLSFKKNDWITVNVGFLSGLLQSGIGLNGPILALTLNSYDLEPIKIRKTLAILFLALSSFSIPLFILSNIVNQKVISLSLLALPFICLGAWLGNIAFDNSKQHHFKLMTMALSVIAALYSIMRILS